MICGFTISYIIRCLAYHFGLGFCVGLLAYWLTLTILSHITGLQDLMGDFSIRHCSLLVAVSCSVAVHILGDYLFGWF